MPPSPASASAAREGRAARRRACTADRGPRCRTRRRGGREAGRAGRGATQFAGNGALREPAADEGDDSRVDVEHGQAANRRQPSRAGGRRRRASPPSGRRRRAAGSGGRRARRRRAARARAGASCRTCSDTGRARAMRPERARRASRPRALPARARRGTTSPGRRTRCRSPGPPRPRPPPANSRRPLRRQLGRPRRGDDVALAQLAADRRDERDRQLGGAADPTGRDRLEPRQHRRARHARRSLPRRARRRPRRRRRSAAQATARGM